MTVKVLRDSKNNCGQQQATSQGSSDWRRNTWCVRVFRNSVITKVICISQNVIAVLNTARLVRHVCWSSFCPSDQSQEALRSLIVPVRIRATRNCSESPKVARNTGSCQKVAEQLVESRPSFRESTLTACSSPLSFTNDCSWQYCLDILQGHQY